MDEVGKRRTLIFLGVVGVSLGVVATIAWPELRQYERESATEIFTYVGDFASKDAALRASIPVLAAEIRKHPEAREYTAIFSSPEPDPVFGNTRRSVFYDRSSGEVGYEADLDSGAVGRVYVVDDSAIEAVARKGGTLEDFGEYDPRLR